MTHISDDLLLSLIEKSLSDEEAAIVTQHITSCEECSTLLEQFVSFQDELNGAVLAEPSEVFVQAVMSRIVPVAAEDNTSWLSFLYRWFPQTASTVAALLLIWGQWGSFAVLDSNSAMLSELAYEVTGFELEPDLNIVPYVDEGVGS